MKRNGNSPKSPDSRLFQTGANLITNAAGSVMPIAAIGIILMGMLAGGGVDFGRRYISQQRMQAACDAGALAGRRAVSPDGFDKDAETQALSFFNSNYDLQNADVANAVVKFSSADDGQTVTGRATGEVETTLLRLAGIESLPVAADCVASMSLTNIDVTMVLDMSGSMLWGTNGSSSAAPPGQQRVDYLRTAMKNFYDVVQPLADANETRIRYAFIPFTANVNIGKALFNTNPNYLANYTELNTRFPVGKWYREGDRKWVWFYGVGTNWPSLSECESVLPIPRRNWAKFRCVYYSPHKKYYMQAYEIWGKNWRYAKKKINTYNYLRGSPMKDLADFDILVEDAWDGCVQEVPSVASATFSYSRGKGYDPAGAHDLDIDWVPDSGDNNTKWQAMVPIKSYQPKRNSNGTIDDTKGNRVSDGGCRNPAQLLEQMSRGAFFKYVDDLIVGGSTLHDVPAVWAGRVTSPDGPFASNVNKRPPNRGTVSRNIIFLTDGETAAAHNYYQQSGIEWLDRKLTPDGVEVNNANLSDIHVERFKAVCAQIRSKGIRIWVIAFGVPLNESMESCASPDSGYEAADGNQLNAAFQDIAAAVAELRIVE